MVLTDRLVWPGLPRLDLNTQTNTSGATGFVPFDFQTNLDKVTKRNCSITFTDGYGSAFFPTPMTVNCQIKGRGNYTWSRPKHPFNLTLCGSNNFTKTAARMFGMSTDTDWCLLADYDDFTHCRDMLSSAIAFAVGQPWASRMIKVELYVNGAYSGLYTFAEKVGVSTERINIAKIKTTDVSGTAVTGGYVLEGEFSGYVDAGGKSFVDIHNGETYSYKVPDSTDVVDAQNTYMAARMNDFLNRLYNVSFSDLTNGWRAVADPVSLAQYFLVQDICRNVDFNSFYITKDRSDVLKGGPFWDAGIAFGLYEGDYSNRGGNNPEDTYYGTIRTWYGKLLTDSYFLGVVKAQYAAALTNLHQLVADFRDYTPKLRGTTTRDGSAHDAIDRDAIRWQNNNHDWPGNFDQNVPRMLTFIKRRLYWQQRRLYFPPTPAHATVYG